MGDKIVTESGVNLSIEKLLLNDSIEVVMRMEEQRKCFLHWGIRYNRFSPWQIPPRQMWPEGSHLFDRTAVQTPFRTHNGWTEIKIVVDRSLEFRLIDFVLFYPEEGRWDNNRGRNYRIVIPGDRVPSKISLGDILLDEIAEEITEKEMSKNSWTLMHRFNLCYDLLDKVRSGSTDGLALLFVWLRYSSIRQLDWQRNYNTKPRELGHAMDRLTVKLAVRYTKGTHSEKKIIRLIMTTLGRGNDAQRVRDEVLHIMHRHGLKEISGHFMEEWHQKLHNNATPDDIVICEALIEFLKSDGNKTVFYTKLKEGGLTKERLRSYERPIRSDPEFIPHLKDVLVSDFEHFLGILKEVHKGTDLGVALHLSGHLMDQEMQEILGYVWMNRNNRGSKVKILARKITEARRRLLIKTGPDGNAVRDILFMDMALEDFLRVAIERELNTRMDRGLAVDLIALSLENLCLSGENSEFRLCWSHWKALSGMTRFGNEWALQAMSVIERIERALGEYVDGYHLLLQPKADFLGKSFHCPPWTVALFTEEVLRGRISFVLSILVHNIGKVLRKITRQGNWQIISPGHKTGRVKTVETLKSLETEHFEHPIIIVAERVKGNEELPQGTAAVITPDSIDILSHLAVRARNMNILFAICYDSDVLGRIRSLEGHELALHIDSASNLVFKESSEHIEGEEVPQGKARLRALDIKPVSGFSAIAMDGFEQDNIGKKSYNLRCMKGKLPEWIRIPPSVALPFGVFEKVLAFEENKARAEKYRELSESVPGSDKHPREYLRELKECVLTLTAPPELMDNLRSVMESEGLSFPQNWEEAWTCIKRVWASKWTERAYLSRRANGIEDNELFMAVLIQKAIDAEYSFVIHTSHPLTRSSEEIYAEAVLGLGEALVGNFPGRAFGFTVNKTTLKTALFSFPSKSMGLFGQGLFFRSDSNGEDLSDYAGAGLYESFMLPSPEMTILDYVDNPLNRDDHFRNKFMNRIGTIGISIEKIMEGPQDIEGVYSEGQYFVVQSRPQVGLGNVS